MEENIGMKICEALGLDPDVISGINIIINSKGTVITTKVLVPKNDTLAEVFQKYQLKEK